MHADIIPTAVADRLFAEAQAAHAHPEKIGNWYGRRSTSCRTTYVCHICGEVIDTEAADWPQTAHARDAIYDHALAHIEAIEEAA